MIGNTKKNPEIVLWGDSHAGMLRESMDNTLTILNKSALFYTFPGCPPSLNIKAIHDFKNNCHRSNKIILENIIASKTIKTVILAARYVQYLEGTSFDNQEGGIETNKWHVKFRPISGNFSEDERKKQVGKSYLDIINKLLNADKKIILIYPIPEVGYHVAHTLYKIIMYNHQDKLLPLTTSYNVYNNRTTTIRKLFDPIDNNNIIRIYPSQIFCNSFMKDRCITHDNNLIFYVDEQHLTIHGANLVTNELAKYLY
ncbi:MAG: hypothetical protein H7833_09310 [Magnetococcus sp. DMHC-1]|nr:hypothetical protein [Magnetococcales bacterium]